MGVRRVTIDPERAYIDLRWDSPVVRDHVGDEVLGEMNVMAFDIVNQDRGPRISAIREDVGRTNESEVRLEDIAHDACGGDQELTGVEVSNHIGFIRPSD